MAETRIAVESLTQVTTVDAHARRPLIAALDAASAVVALVNPSGAVPPRYLGGKGDAPGKFACASRAVFHGDSLGVLDHCRGHLIVLTLDGREVRRVEIGDARATVGPYARLAWFGDTLFLSREESALRDRTDATVRRATDELVMVVDESFTVLETRPNQWLNLARGGPPFIVPAPFTHRLLWDLNHRAGVLAISRTGEEEIEVRSFDGVKLQRFSVPAEQPPVREADRRNVREQYAVDLQGHRSVDLRRLTFPPHKPLIRSLRFDPDGGLWVHVAEPGPEGAGQASVLVYRWSDRPDSAAKSQWFRSPCFPLAFLTATRFVCRGVDSLGVNDIRVYTIRSRSGASP